MEVLPTLHPTQPPETCKHPINPIIHLLPQLWAVHQSHLISFGNSVDESSEQQLAFQDIYAKVQNISYKFKEYMALLVASQDLQVKISWLFLSTSCILTTTPPHPIFSAHINTWLLPHSSFPNTALLFQYNSPDASEFTEWLRVKLFWTLKK